ncbi:hypothetical protein BSL78_09057 [Apostichopus japonicus]|uniref:Uncharacterized protein n=1 Tax=Stichopus japonicus TaxID=307972 RepID=A0A2G8L187_STIJA|nr:hypothetical protein BSL78_09057 [Apostichopus japonicus]
MFSPQSNSISEAISNRYIMASYVLGIIACLAVFIIHVSQAEVHLMVPSENVRDGKNQTFYCLFSDPTQDVVLKYRPEKEDAGENNYTTHRRSVREEHPEACNYTAARFSVSSSSGSGYYHCALDEEKSLEVFVNVQQNTSSVSCFSRSFIETNQACVTCLSGNGSTLFHEARTESTDQRLNCNATTDGGVSCNFLPRWRAAEHRR